MEEEKVARYIELKNLAVYKSARLLSKYSWQIYEKLHWRLKQSIGDQFVRSTDSVGANIAEGYARFHYLDRIKFYYNARGSLSECSEHWIELLLERKLAEQDIYSKFKSEAENCGRLLNSFISANYALIKKSRPRPS